MHDPEFVLFDVHLPIPVRRWPENRPGPWSLTVSRRTNEENLGQRVYPWWRPQGYRLVLGGQRIGMWHVATIWHHEPGDRDSGEVCKGRHTLRWGWEHRSHCRVRVTAFGRYVRWYRDRCDSCGYRFALKEGRYGTWGGDEVFHYRCQAADTAGRQLNDAYAYMAHRELGHAVDWNVKWRVERELARRQEIEVEFDKIGEPS